jgi:hypothetical protein
MAGADKTLILIGFEGPELKNDTTRFYWHPRASDPHWRMLIKRAVIDFLRRSADDEWRWDATSADVAMFRDASGLTRALGKNRYQRVVIYSHGFEHGLIPIIDKSYVREYALAKALAESGVKMALLLGCNSKRLAQDAARIAEGVVRIGGIEPIRDDAADKKQLNILNTIIWSYGGGAR